MRDLKDYIIHWVDKGFKEKETLPKFKEFQFGHNWNSHVPEVVKKATHKDVLNGIYVALTVMFRYTPNDQLLMTDWRIEDIKAWLSKSGLPDPPHQFHPDLSSGVWLIYYFLKLQKDLDKRNQ